MPCPVVDSAVFGSAGAVGGAVAGGAAGGAAGGYLLHGVLLTQLLLGQVVLLAVLQEVLAAVQVVEQVVEEVFSLCTAFVFDNECAGGGGGGVSPADITAIIGVVQSKRATAPRLPPIWFGRCGSIWSNAIRSRSAR